MIDNHLPLFVTFFASFVSSAWLVSRYKRRYFLQRIYLLMFLCHWLFLFLDIPGELADIYKIQLLLFPTGRNPTELNLVILGPAFVYVNLFKNCWPKCILYDV